MHRTARCSGYLKFLIENVQLSVAQQVIFINFDADTTVLWRHCISPFYSRYLAITLDHTLLTFDTHTAAR